MHRLRNHSGFVTRWQYSALLMLAIASTAYGQGAVRDLSAFSEPGTTFTLSITIAEPPGATILGIEDAPPFGWTVSSISDSGTWDPGTLKVKWLFFDPPFPSVVTYDVTSPVGDVGDRCFDGTVTFDTDEDAISGDQCLSVGVPAVSQWGLIAIALGILTAATLKMRDASLNSP